MKKLSSRKEIFRHVDHYPTGFQDAQTYLSASQFKFLVKMSAQTTHLYTHQRYKNNQYDSIFSCF